MYVMPSAPQSIGGVIDDAIRLYRNSFSRCWLLALIPSALYGAVMLAAALAGPRYGVTGGQGAQIFAAQQAFGRGMLGYFAIAMVVMIAFQGAIFVRQAAVARGDDSLSLMSAVTTGFARMPLFILSLMLFYLGLVGGAVTVMLVVALPIGWVLNHQHLLTRPVMTAGAVVIVLIPIVYLMGRLQLFAVALFADRKGPKTALVTSWQLTKGHWWRAMAILAVGWAIIVVLFIAITLLNDVFAFITHFGSSYRLFAFPLILAVFYTFMYPMGPALFLAMYHDFKLRREGGDLAARVGALNSA
jgi:hypothetical protein